MRRTVPFIVLVSSAFAMACSAGADGSGAAGNASAQTSTDGGASDAAIAANDAAAPLPATPALYCEAKSTRAEGDAIVGAMLYANPVAAGAAPEYAAYVTASDPTAVDLWGDETYDLLATAVLAAGTTATSSDPSHPAQLVVGAANAAGHATGTLTAPAIFPAPVGAPAGTVVTVPVHCSAPLAQTIATCAPTAAVAAAEAEKDDLVQSGFAHVKTDADPLKATYIARAIAGDAASATIRYHVPIVSYEDYTKTSIKPSHPTYLVEIHATTANGQLRCDAAKTELIAYQ